MILTPLHPAKIPHVLGTFAAALPTTGPARAVFARIGATQRFCPGFTADLWAGQAKAVALAVRMGIPTRDEDPAIALSYDGHAIRTRSETSVVFHEIAHWQVAPAARRSLPDFGLGAGPETGNVAAANAATCVDAATQEQDENLASLLGILWEVAHDEPAILAFAEQNWLELYERPSTAAHFIACLQELMDRGLVDADGLPILPQSLSAAA